MDERLEEELMAITEKVGQWVQAGYDDGDLAEMAILVEMAKAYSLLAVAQPLDRIADNLTLLEVINRRG